MFDQPWVQVQVDPSLPAIAPERCALLSAGFYFGYFYFAYAWASGRCSTRGEACQK